MQAIIHEITNVKTLGNKNGIVLNQVTMLTTSKVYFELFMDGELLNRFTNKKIAERMFKDFSK